MLPVIWTAIRAYAPYITLPVAAVIGFIGYHVEGIVSEKSTPYKKKSIEEERDERLLEEFTLTDATQVKSLKDNKFVPKSVLNKNLSPSLKEE